MTDLRAKFLIHHAENPRIYDRLLKKCFELWDHGWLHLSTRDMLSALRYDFALEMSKEEVTVAGGEMMKIRVNNNHSAYYSRLIAYHHTRFERVFKYRRVAGEVDGEVILFSDVPGDPDRTIGTPVPQAAPPRLRTPVPAKPGVRLRVPKRRKI